MISRRASLGSKVLVDDHPANRYANAEIQLAQNGHRYVVLHEPPSADVEGDSK